jgi:hypothetical protein
MIGMFPTLQADELFYSACARYADLMGYPNHHAVQHALFGTTTATAVVDLPSQLARFVARLPGGGPYTVPQLLDGHTLLPYYQRFMKTAQHATLVAAMTGERGGAINLVTGRAPSRVPATAQLRYCDTCIDEDIGQMGTPAWRRIHQAPGVVLCPIHRARLRESGLRVLGRTLRHGFVSLACVRDGSDAVLPLRGPRHHLQTLAEDTAWLLAHPGAPTPPAELFRRYRSALAARGWIRGRMQVRMRELREAFQAHYGSELLASLGCDFEPRDGDWLGRLLRKPRTGQHPVRHLLVMRFLELSPAEFFGQAPDGSLGTERASGCEDGDRAAREGCPNPVCVSIRVGSEAAESVSTVPAVVGVSPRVVVCGTCGFAYESGRREGRGRSVVAYGPVWERALRELAADPEVALKRIAKRLGVDQLTVRRQAHRLGVWRDGWSRKGLGQISREAYRTACRAQIESRRGTEREGWLALRAAHPKASMGELMDLAPTGLWLTKYDRPWLRAHQPTWRKETPRSLRVDWPARDAELVAALHSAMNHLLAQAGEPVQLSAAALRRATGRHAQLERGPELLPRCHAFLAAVAEPPLTFARRRAHWAAEQFLREGITPPRWRLVRRAGLRAEPEAALREELDSLVEALTSLVPRQTVSG